MLQTKKMRGSKNKKIVKKNLKKSLKKVKTENQSVLRKSRFGSVFDILVRFFG